LCASYNLLCNTRNLFCAELSEKQVDTYYNCSHTNIFARPRDACVYSVKAFLYKTSPSYLFICLIGDFRVEKSLPKGIKICYTYFQVALGNKSLESGQVWKEAAVL